MRNLISHILFNTKRDAKRTYNNILWFIQHKESVSEKDLKEALAFELQSYQTTEDNEKVIFLINKDYSTTNFSVENFQEGLELFHQYLMQNASWYKSLLRD